MTPRPALSSKRRPSSAIFLGAGPPDSIPDLPEPPEPHSPGASSSGSNSGLPSPPATNSTGSGGDVGSVRHRSSSVSDANMNMPNGHRCYEKSPQPKQGSVVDSDEEDDNEEHTAKFNNGRRRSLAETSENAAALQRIKSLNQRSRAVMDKLSSRSRVNSPAPSASTRSSIALTQSTSMSSSSSSASSRHSAVSRSRGNTLSGSETEREGRGEFGTLEADDDISMTPPTTSYMHNVRQRRISAPSPGKGLTALNARRQTASPGLNRTPGKRASVALPLVDTPDDYADRYSTTSNRRTRNPLPREFMARSSSDEGLSVGENVLSGRGSPSPRAGNATLFSPSMNAQLSRPPRANHISARSSTVREVTRKHQSRWFSEDLSGQDVEYDDGDGEKGGRRQVLRGGSAESPLAAFQVGERSLVGEGLRAAGIGARRKDNDMFSNDGDTGLTRRSTTGSTVTSAHITPDVHVNGKGQGRVADRDLRDNPRTPANRLSLGGTTSRPSSSMASSNNNHPPNTAPLLRTYKSTYDLPDRDREDAAIRSNSRARSVLDSRGANGDTFRSSPDGSADGARAIGRSGTSGTFSRASAAAIAQAAEHTRLMFNALSMFEDRLNHLPDYGGLPTTIPEVFRSAKSMAAEMERLNGLLRDSTTKAMNEHIQASVNAEDPQATEQAETWRQVGGEFREGLRVSDELVRMMTEFLLGVGKALKDVSAPLEASPSQHLRTVSLDEEVVRRLTPEHTGLANGTRRGTSDGSRSSTSRRSWEPPPRASSRLDASALVSSRPATSMAQPRERTRKISFEMNAETPSRAAALAASTSTNLASSSSRRLFSPLEQRDKQIVSANQRANAPHKQASDLMETVRGVDRSPTTGSRILSHVAERGVRPRIPSLTIPRPRPPPLPTLPSESHITRGTAQTHRPKPSNSSVATIRAALKFPGSKSSAATVAVTPHSVTNSPLAMPSPLLKSESSSSGREVSFSRPSTTAVNELQQSRSRRLSNANGDGAPDLRQRTVSGTSLLDEEPISPEEVEVGYRARTMAARNRTAALETSRGGENVTLARAGSQKERRRTVTEIFSRN